MLWRCTANLIKVQKTVNENGYKRLEETRRKVFCNKKSATRSEFYAAKQAGDKIALVLEVRGADFQEETQVEFAGKRYEVVRAYTKSGEVFELNCKEAPEAYQDSQYSAGSDY